MRRVKCLGLCVGSNVGVYISVVGMSGGSVKCRVAQMSSAQMSVLTNWLKCRGIESAQMSQLKCYLLKCQGSCLAQMSECYLLKCRGSCLAQMSVRKCRG